MSFRTVVITRQSKISYKNRFLVVKQENDEKYIHLSEIDTVIVEATNPPIGAEFTDSVYQHSTLIVPEGCIDAYRQTDGWKEFCNIFTPSTTDIKGYKYDLEKIKIEHNSSGINILNATNSDVPQIRNRPHKMTQRSKR